MSMDVSKEGDVLVAVPAGRLDSNNAKAFEEDLLGRIEAGETKILVDFSKLDYISSAGLRVFLMAAKRMKAADGKLVLCALSENVREVFEISGFNNILDIKGARAEGLAAFA